jgi:hypothetical protein
MLVAHTRDAIRLGERSGFRSFSPIITSRRFPSSYISARIFFSKFMGGRPSRAIGKIVFVFPDLPSHSTRARMWTGRKVRASLSDCATSCGGCRRAGARVRWILFCPGAQRRSCLRRVRLSGGLRTERAGRASRSDCRSRRCTRATASARFARHTVRVTRQGWGSTP